MDKADFNSMSKYLNESDWCNTFSTLDANTMWTTFCDKLDKAVDKFVPHGSRKSNSFPKCMTRRAREARKYKSAI